VKAFREKQAPRLSLLVPLLLFLVALVLRLWDIRAVHFQFDEWLGGWHANPDPLQGGNLPALLKLFWSNTREYVASGQTAAWSALIETFQLLFGPGVWKVRLLAALGGAFGTATVFLVGRRQLRDALAAAAGGLMSAFSVVGIIFGQFADVYAAAILATSLQLWAWQRLTRARESRTAWGWFAAASLVAQLLMYTQVWITAACFLTVVASGRRRWRKVLRRAFVPAAAYLALSLVHLYGMLRLIPWSESYRWYMAPYYPVADGGAAGGTIRLLVYFPLRIYDLLSYHWAAVFDPSLYQPLSWNPVFFPFLGLLLAALIIFLRGPRRGGGSIASLALAAVGLCLAANVFLLIPFGGIRQTLFLSPILSLFYGWAVFQLIGAGRSSRWFRRAAGGVCCLLPLVPFLLSLPGIYQDRLPRLDLDVLAGFMQEHRVSDLCASEQNIQVLELAMRDSSLFTQVDWAGYSHPADALDADFRRRIPVLSFKCRGIPGRVHWVTREYFPAALERAIWVDMHISAGSRYEGEGMKRFYPDPAAVVRENLQLQTLAEFPGNSPAALHQSLYWPPNSYYLYLLQARE